MINLEIINSPDQMLSKSYISHKNSASIGTDENNSFIINDNSMPKHAITLKVDDNKLLLDNEKSNTPYLINGKKASGRRSIKINDIIGIGKTEFKLINFLKIEAKHNHIFFTQKYKELFSDTPDISILIEIMEDELVRLQAADSNEL